MLGYWNIIIMSLDKFRCQLKILMGPFLIISLFFFHKEIFLFVDLYFLLDIEHNFEMPLNIQQYYHNVDNEQEQNICNTSLVANYWHVTNTNFLPVGKRSFFENKCIRCGVVVAAHKHNWTPALYVGIPKTS